MQLDNMPTKSCLDLEFDKVEQYSYSRLYNLKPIGVGTTYVESITSYTGRLAQAHCVSVGNLVSKEIVPIIRKPWMASQHGYIFSQNSSQCRAINGRGIMAEDWVAAMEHLTFRKELMFTTMLPWGRVIAQRNLIRKFRAWCPLCYGEQNDGSGPFDTLLWALEGVTACKIHQRCLSTKCPSCGRSLSLIASEYSPGFCGKCHTWLGSPEDKQKTEDLPTEFEYWKTESIGNLLAMTPTLHTPATRENLMASIRSAIRSVGSLTALATLTGFDPQTTRAWVSGKFLPQLEAIS